LSLEKKNKKINKTELKRKGVSKRICNSGEDKDCEKIHSLEFRSRRTAANIKRLDINIKKEVNCLINNYK
jgi:hypothetical protein